MYAYAKVIIERPGVQALPESALTYSGEKAYCWTRENGHAVRTEVQTGVSDGEWIEVTNRQLSQAADGTDPWVPIDGSEQVIVGDLSLLAEGAPIEVAPGTEEAKLAHAIPAPDADLSPVSTNSAHSDGGPTNGDPAGGSC